MNTNVVFGVGIVVGIVIGILFEHQRFLMEIQGLSKKHSADNTTETPTAANAPGVVDTETAGASEVLPA